MLIDDGDPNHKQPTALNIVRSFFPRDALFAHICVDVGG